MQHDRLPMLFQDNRQGRVDHLLPASLYLARALSRRLRIQISSRILSTLQHKL